MFHRPLLKVISYRYFVGCHDRWITFVGTVVPHNKSADRTAPYGDAVKEMQFTLAVFIMSSIIAYLSVNLGQYIAISTVYMPRGAGFIGLHEDLHLFDECTIDNIS